MTELCPVMTAADYSDEEFVGYTFQGSPERRPRLWFLDRHVCLLLSGCWPSSGTNPGPVDVSLDVGNWTTHDCPTGDDEKALDGVCLRYQHAGAEKWTAVWRLTDTTIPHVHTFGREDDVWRLALWPD
jgi:hypothetical protein